MISDFQKIQMHLRLTPACKPQDRNTASRRTLVRARSLEDPQWCPPKPIPARTTHGVEPDRPAGRTRILLQVLAS